MNLPHEIDCEAVAPTAREASLAVQTQATRATQPWRDDPDWVIRWSDVRVSIDATDNFDTVLSWRAEVTVALIPKETQR